ncbi:MAG TPA: sodium:dicarboxylate symporter, partial [Flavobacteriales bacterium]|nr:sodium:dicarboxylate symporter [Flavobacteriales bacterium]
TAATAMLLPAVMAIGVQLERDERLEGITAPLLIGLGFAASIGGMATLIGTAPNMIFLKEYTSAFPNGTSIGFATWMMFGIPISIVIFLGCYYALRFQFRKVMIKESIDLTRCHSEYHALGKTSYEERWMLFFFIMAILMWFFLSELKFGSLTIPPWTSLFGLPPKMIVESTVAMIIAFLLFFIPSRDGKDTLLSFAEVRRLPIGIIFLFGGGFAISKAVVSTGLDQSMAGALSGVAHLHPVLIVLILAVFMTLLSEFASNTASLQLVFPVLVSFVGALPVDPLLVLIPVTLAASCGFMLPIATPPNTIVFGSERITAGQMIKAGFMVDLVGIIVITISAFTLIALVLGV